MTGRLALLAGVAAGLAGIVAWELGGDGLPEPARPASVASPRPGAAAAVPDRTGDWAATLLARPLFSPDRRPPAPGPAGPATAEAPLPRLTGILVTPEGRSAIFAGSLQAIVVQEGGIVGRFSVQRIEPGRVTLAGPSGVVAIGPAFNPAAPQPRPAPSALGALPPMPGPSLGLADAPQDAMPFDRNPSPSGMDIIREQARRQAPGAGPRP